MTTFLIDKESGFGETAQGITVPGKIEKMGYKGVDTTELILDNHRTSSTLRSWVANRARASTR